MEQCAGAVVVVVATLTIASVTKLPLRSGVTTIALALGAYQAGTAQAILAPQTRVVPERPHTYITLFWGSGLACPLPQGCVKDGGDAEGVATSSTSGLLANLTSLETRAPLLGLATGQGRMSSPLQAHF